MVTFVGGVRDAQGMRAFIPVAAGTVVAVDLRGGDVLWRRAVPGRPIAATTRRLLTLARDGAHVVIRMFDAATGEPTASTTDVGIPPSAVEEDRAIQIDASETSGGIAIGWRARQPYRGGAAPPASVQARAGDEMAGAVLIDPETAAIRTQTPPSPAGRLADERTLEPPLASADPSVVALDRVGERTFALKAVAAGGALRIVLEARDGREGPIAWESTLAERPPAKPAPLRK